MNISENLKKFREKNNISQTDMAKKLNITRQAYNHYETGKRVPPIETLKLISDIFEIGLERLVNDARIELKDTHLNQNKKEEETPKGIYFRLAKEAEAIGLDEDDINEILAVYKRHKERNK